MGEAHENIPKSRPGLSRGPDCCRSAAYTAYTAHLCKRCRGGEERLPQSSSDASLTLMRNPAPKGTQATSLYEIGAKTPAEPQKGNAAAHRGRARLSWEWKGGPPSGGDSPGSQLGRKLSTVAPGLARGHAQGAGPRTAMDSVRTPPRGVLPSAPHGRVGAPRWVRVLGPRAPPKG